MKKEVKQFNITGFVISILEIILGLISFLVGAVRMYACYITSYFTFGADFYSDIYEATANAANNVYYLIQLVSWLLIIIGILIILGAVKNLVTAIKGEKPRPVYMIESNNETNKQE